jgi:hypothetical protein
MHLDFYVVGEAEAWLVVPANAPLPAVVAEALGRPRFAWTAELGDCIDPACRKAVCADLDVDGCSLLAVHEVFVPPPSACARAA